MMRFLAIWLMMMVHVPHGSDFVTARIGLNYETGLTFAIEGLGRIASPLLGLVSGYFCVALVERSGTRGLTRKKVSTLLVPLVFWSGALYAMFFALFLLSGGRHFGASINVGVDRIVGLWTMPLNVPLHYLTDLFKCCLIFAAANIVLDARGAERPVRSNCYLALGVALCAVILWARLQYNLPAFVDDEGDFRILIRNDLALFFFWGVAAAYRNIEISDVSPRFDRSVSWFLLGLLLVLLAFLSSASVKLQGLYGFHSIQYSMMDLVKRSVGAFIMISAISKFSRRGWIFDVPRQITFRLFCSHAVVFAFISAAAVTAEVKIFDSAAKLVLLMVLFPTAAIFFAWASVEAQRRVAWSLRPGLLKRLVQGIP